jgi:hypothetical protein
MVGGDFLFGQALAFFGGRQSGRDDGSNVSGAFGSFYQSLAHNKVG